MARELTVLNRRFWIVSEPQNMGWRARVLELHGSADDRAVDLGIEATADTQTAADLAAEGKLQRFLRGE